MTNNDNTDSQIVYVSTFEFCYCLMTVHLKRLNLPLRRLNAAFISVTIVKHLKISAVGAARQRATSCRQHSIKTTLDEHELNRYLFDRRNLN